MNYLSYLVLVLVLVAWFGRRFDDPPGPPARAIRWLRRLLLPTEPPTGPDGMPTRPGPDSPPMGPARLAGLIAVVLLVFAASTVSHQLTPAAMVVCGGVLVLTGCCTTRALPTLMAVILAAYVSYGTVPYWSNHLHDMFGSVGQVGGTVSKGAVQRVRGDLAHQIVVLSRVGLAATVWGLAAVGAWRRMRHGRAGRALLVLAGAPFLLLAVQSYGGEIFLRVYAFALPFMATLMAAVPAAAWPVRRRALTGLLSAVLVGAF